MQNEVPAAEKTAEIAPIETTEPVESVVEKSSEKTETPVEKHSRPERKSRREQRDERRKNTDKREGNPKDSEAMSLMRKFHTFGRRTPDFLLTKVELADDNQ